VLSVLKLVSPFSESKYASLLEMKTNIYWKSLAQADRLLNSAWRWLLLAITDLVVVGVNEGRGIN
jgi:hypothetical protein